MFSVRTALTGLPQYRNCQLCQVSKPRCADMDSISARWASGGQSAVSRAAGRKRRPYVNYSRPVLETDAVDRAIFSCNSRPDWYLILPSLRFWRHAYFLKITDRNGKKPVYDWDTAREDGGSSNVTATVEDNRRWPFRYLQLKAQ